MTFTLPTSITHLKTYAARYDYKTKAEFDALDQRLKGKMQLTKEDLLAFIAWKSPRTTSRIKANDEQEVQSISQIALAMTEPYLAVHTLTALTGVGISVASAIMAFVNPDVHAVMDRHTVRALGEKNMYLGTWKTKDYKEYLVFLQQEKGTQELRVLEQGLFMYSRLKLGKLPRKRLI